MTPEQLNTNDASLIPDSEPFLANKQFRSIDVRMDEKNSSIWYFMNPKGRPSFTPQLLTDIVDFQQCVRSHSRNLRAAGKPPIKYCVLGSLSRGIFNLGGDLELFAEKIQSGDAASLRRYAHLCIEAIYNNSVAFDLPIVTIAMVQGDALGGGFEAALAHDIIIAEKSAKFGLPEVLFSLFPGMGAYSFLARRLDAARAEKMILSGKIYSADELHEIGLVDVVAEDGMGELVVQNFLQRNQKRHGSYSAIYKSRRIVAPVSLDELIRITDIWVDTAMSLTESEIKKMKRLASAQDKRISLIE